MPNRANEKKVVLFLYLFLHIKDFLTTITTIKNFSLLICKKLFYCGRKAF